MGLGSWLLQMLNMQLPLQLRRFQLYCLGQSQDKDEWISQVGVHRILERQRCHGEIPFLGASLHQLETR